MDFRTGLWNSVNVVFLYRRKHGIWISRVIYRLLFTELLYRQYSSLAFDAPFPSSQCLCSFCSLILICLYWLKTLFDLEWPILKCLHSGKECQVAYAKTYLNMQCNGKFGCALQNVTSNVSVVKYWASWSFPDENPPSRKEIISNYQWGDYCIGLWWILFDLKRNA